MNPSRRNAALLVALALSGCTAVRGTVHLARGMQSVNDVRETQAPTDAIYAWTLAEEYRKKAWDEWCGSDYEEAERASKLAAEWAQKADNLARSGGALQILDPNPSWESIKAAYAVLNNQATPPEVPAVEEESP